MTTRKCKDKTDSVESECSVPNDRRILLTKALAVSLLPWSIGMGHSAADSQRSSRPQKGDVLVFAEGPSAGRKISASEIQQGAPPKFAYPMDPASGAVRDGSRLNQLLLVRLASTDIAPASQRLAAEGILAYSAICTHYGCQVTLLHENKRSVICNCHGSTFDAGNAGEVLMGPAARRLAGLPLAITDGFITVGGAFTGRLGPPTA